MGMVCLRPVYARAEEEIGLTCGVSICAKAVSVTAAAVRTSPTGSLLIYVHRCIHMWRERILVSYSLYVCCNLRRGHLRIGGQIHSSGGAHFAHWGTSYICPWTHLLLGTTRRRARILFFCFCICVFGYLWREHLSEGGQLDRSGSPLGHFLYMYMVVSIGADYMPACAYSCFCYLWREHLSEGGQLDRSGGAHFAHWVTSYICPWIHLLLGTTRRRARAFFLFLLMRFWLPVA